VSRVIRLCRLNSRAAAFVRETKASSGFRKRTVFFIWLALSASGIPTIHGQSALDGYDPGVNQFASVYVAALQPDGKTVIGGFFGSLSPMGGVSVTRNNKSIAFCRTVTG
jgi:hypothetical protein